MKKKSDVLFFSSSLYNLQNKIFSSPQNKRQDMCIQVLINFDITIVGVIPFPGYSPGHEIGFLPSLPYPNHISIQLPARNRTSTTSLAHHFIQCAFIGVLGIRIRKTKIQLEAKFYFKERERSRILKRILRVITQAVVK